MNANNAIVVRNGVDCEVYNWNKDYDKESFERLRERKMARSGSQEFVSIIEINKHYLINHQERTVTEINNEEVKKFIYHNIYSSNLNETYIDLFINGGYEMKEWD